MKDIFDQIDVIEQRRAEALMKGDVAMLDRLTDDDYVHVEANGQERDKAGFLAAVAGGVRFSRYDLKNNFVRIFGDVAVVTGDFENEMIRPSGDRLTRSGRHCRVYVRSAGGWRNVLHQGTATENRS